MEILDHPNIVKFMDVYPTEAKKLCIVMEYAESGDIQSNYREVIKKAREENK